jgi:hypothetical protein
MHRRHAWALLGAAGLRHQPEPAGAGTNLIDAVKAGDRASVRTLLSKTTVNAAEADGMTALHWAVRADDAETAQL